MIHFAYGQIKPSQIDFKKLPGELSESSIVKIMQDSHGFLWIGTTNGVVKYDGTTFYRFDNYYDDYFLKGFVNDIFETESGNIYIATHRGLMFYDRGLESLKQYSFGEHSKTVNNFDIITIREFDNNLWIGTSKNGLYKYNKVTKTIQTFDVSIDKLLFNDVIHISQLSRGKYFVVSRFGAHVVDENLKLLYSLKLDNVTTVKKVNSKEFLLGSFAGDLQTLVLDSNLKPEIVKEIQIAPFRIAAIEIDKEHNIWVAPENDGLYILDSQKHKLLHLKNTDKDTGVLPNNSIWSIYKSQDGTIWLGSFKRGLSYNSGQNLKFQHYKVKSAANQSVNNNLITSFYEDDTGNLWIGTDGGGLNYWNRKTDRYEYFSLNNGSLESNVVLSIVKKKDKLWLATWASGILVFDIKTKKYKAYNSSNSNIESDYIQDLFIDSYGKLWVGSFKGGLFIYNETRDDFEKFNLINKNEAFTPFQIITIYEDDNKNIWVGTHADGLIHLKHISESTYELQQPTLLMNDENDIYFDFINTIFQDYDNRIWVGTDYGLGYYDDDSGKLIKYLESKPIINLSVESIEQDSEGYLWLGTSKGLLKYNPNTKDVVTYSLSDAIQGNNFNSSASMVTSSKEFVFGGSNGFNLFNPLKIKKRENVPNLYISKLKIHNKEVVPNDAYGVLSKNISQVDTLRLDYTHNVINFEFATITYMDSNSVRYAYYLEGFENDWNYVGNKNDVTYTNLNHGEYVFHVKSTNSDGVWVDNEKTLIIEIIPPFWKTLWFIILVLSSIFLLIFLIFYTRHNRIKATQRYLEKQIADRTFELEQQTKKLMTVADQLTFKNEEIQRFAFSVSHDLKSPLSNVKTIAELLQLEFSEKEPTLQNYLDMINSSCDAMSELIEDITRVARLGKIQNKEELIDLNRVIRISKQIINAKFEENNVTLIIENHLPMLVADRNRLIQVFSNLFDNAIKYKGNQSKPCIKISSEETEELVVVKVADNGSGMAANHLEKLFSPFERFHPGTKGTGLGLYMIKQIIESHSGTIKAESKGVNQGTTFIITMPKNKV